MRKIVIFLFFIGALLLFTKSFICGHALAPTIYETSPNSLSVGWPPDTIYGYGYTVMLSTNTNFIGSMSRSDFTNSVNQSYSSLYGNMPYYVKVKTANEDDTHYSNPVSTTTNVQMPSIAGFQVFTTSITVFVASIRNLTPISLIVSSGSFETSNSSSTAYNNSGSTMTLILSNLSPNTNYAIQARVERTDSTSSSSTYVTSSTTTLTATTSVQGTVSGQVTQSNDQAITGVEVRSEAESGSSSINTGLTGTDGSFSLSDLDSSRTYKITASWTVNSIKSSAYRTGISANGSSSINFKLGVSYSLSTVSGQLSLSPSAVRQFQQAQSRAAPGVSAQASSFVELYQDGRKIFQQYTDQDGRYSIPNLLPGVYQARAYNGKSYSQMETVRLGGGTFALTFKFDLLPEEGVYNYPNPIIVPRNGSQTTLRFETGENDSDAEIDILTLSGNLVRKISLGEMNSEGLVYTYHWNLTNSMGEFVASGVYLMRVRVRNLKTDEKAVVTKKIAIVR